MEYSKLTKKHRIESTQSLLVTNDNDSSHAPLAYLDDKIMLHILHYLPWDTLDAMECVSRQYRDIRRAKRALHNTREAVLTFLPPLLAGKSRLFDFDFSKQYKRLVFLDFQNAYNCKELRELGLNRTEYGIKERPYGINPYRIKKEHHVRQVTIKGDQSGFCPFPMFYDLLQKMTRVEEAHIIDVHFQDGLKERLYKEYKFGMADLWPILSHLNCNSSSVHSFLNMELVGFSFLKAINLDNAIVKEPNENFMLGAAPT